MPWAIREATIASTVVVLSIRSALVFKFAADVQIGLALSRGGVFPFRRGSAKTAAQLLACYAPRKRHRVPPAVAITRHDFGCESGGYWIVRSSRTMTLVVVPEAKLDAPLSYPHLR